MPRRSEQRRAAVIALYQHDLTGRPLAQTLPPDASLFVRALAHEILAARPYSFLDDAPLEERRTQAVRVRRWLDPETAADLGALDAAAIERVRAEAWPEAETAEPLAEWEQELLASATATATVQDAAAGAPESTTDPS